MQNISEYCIEVLDQNRKLVIIKCCSKCQTGNCDCGLAQTKAVLTDQQFTELTGGGEND